MFNREKVDMSAPGIVATGEKAEEGTNAINGANNRSPVGLLCMQPPVAV